MTKTRNALILPLALASFAVFAALFPARAEVRNPNGVAVIVGNRAYAHERVPEVRYAHRDAEAFKRYVLDVLGFDPENVIDLRDADQARMESAFGNERSHEGLLWRYLDPAGGSDVVVFYSGHGVPGLKDRRGYLLPSNADPNTAEINGYPIDVLYRNLAKLGEARSVRVFLDACFSGDSDGGMLVRSASPVFVTAAMPEGMEKLTILTASSGAEVASWDEKAEHGLFTHHLLDALYGRGDGDGDGAVTAAEAKAYLDRHMTRAARRKLGRHQNANLRGASEVVLASVAESGVFPSRPVVSVDFFDNPVGPKVEELDEWRWALAGAAVREGPGNTQEELERIESGTRVKVTGQVAAGNEAWMRIALPDGGAGFVPASRLDVERPRRSAEELEKSLGLGRADRVAVQRGLSSLGHDVGMADGVFGVRTRTGIEAYQRGKGLPETGYLTAELSAGLQALGEDAEVEARRREEAARLEAQEAERRRLEQERAERERVAREAEEARRERLRPGSVIRDCEGCPELVVVPSGSFQMGSPLGESGRLDSEGPVHRVTIVRPFAVGVYEVTRGEYGRFVSSTGWSSGDSCWVYEGGEWKDRSGRSWRSPGFHQGDSHPVVCVSWEDAQGYVEWLSDETGEEYRLLSESEWEYVARGGTETAYHFGSSLTSSRANYGRNNDGTVRVGRYGTNGFGLHDVHGNVWEWVEDCWNDSYHGAPTDGSVWKSGDCGKRVLRGGSWSDGPRYLRSAFRLRYPSGGRDSVIGFRVARTLD